MDKRYQIFVSSTFEDLKDERQGVLKAILEMDHMPAGMELFPAGDEAAWRLICDVIDASDYYVLIIGGRYGSLDEAGIGYTEKEYDYAISKRKPIVPLLHADPNNLPRGRTETSPAAWQRLQAFREKIEKHHTCAYWKTHEDLKAQVIVGLTSTIKKSPAQGWVRAGSLSSAEASQEILDLRRLVDHQREELDRLSSTPPQGSERLAQGSDNFEFEFKVTLTKDNAAWNARDRLRTAICKAYVTWDELFGACAPTLIHPTRESQMKARIESYLRQKHDLELRSQDKGYHPTHASISDSLFQTIKVQFMALGMLDVRLESKVVGSGRDEKDVPVCQLSALGKRHLVIVKAITRASPIGQA